MSVWGQHDTRYKYPHNERIVHSQCYTVNVKHNEYGKMEIRTEPVFTIIPTESEKFTILEKRTFLPCVTHSYLPLFRQTIHFVISEIGQLD
jgi:hypothetical protein